MGDSTECSTRQAHGVGVPRGAGGRGAAFLISLAGPESAVPIGAGLGAQKGQRSWCCLARDGGEQARVLVKHLLALLHKQVR